MRIFFGIALLLFGCVPLFASLHEGFAPGIAWGLVFVGGGAALIVSKIMSQAKIAAAPVGETTDNDKMKVTISRSEEERGLIGQRILHFVTLNVQFSAAEGEAIRKYKLRDTVVDAFKIEMPDGRLEDMTYTIGELSEGKFRRSFPTAVDADNYELEIRNTILPNLKAFIARHGEQRKEWGGTGTKVDTFEM